MTCLSTRFTGKQIHAETGLDYFNARYYSPAQGRFTSPDPGNAGANPADPQTWNMYAYVNNSPLNYTDPTGEGIWSILGGIGAGVGTFFGTGNPWAAVKLGMQVASIGGAVEAAIKGEPAPGAGFAGLPGISDWTGCGNPLGNCGSINQRPWNEDMIGPRVQDPQRFVFTVRPEEQIHGWWETIQKHLGKLEKSPNSTEVDHWRKEIRTAARSIWDKAEQVTKKRRADGFEKYLQRVLGIGADELSKFLRTPIIIVDPCLVNPSLAGCRKPTVF